MNNEGLNWIEISIRDTAIRQAKRAQESSLVKLVKYLIGTDEDSDDEYESDESTGCIQIYIEASDRKVKTD